MIPYKLTLRNFMCYRDDVPPLLFDGIHIACLSGDNGAGKSTLLDAMTWALWGKARGKSDDDLIALGCDDMEVDFEWQIAGSFYRVIRRRTKSKRSGLSIVELQVQSADGGWRRMSGDSVRDTNIQIINILRMSYDTFINSAFLMQGRADEWTNSTPQARKQVLGDMLGLAEYEQLEKQAKQRRDKAEAALRRSEDVIADYERQAQHLPLLQAELQAAEARVRSAEREVSDKGGTASTLREQAQQLRQMAERHAVLQTQLADREQRQADLEQALVQLRGRVASHRAIIAQTTTIQANYDALQLQRQALQAMDQRRDQAMELREQWTEHRDAVQSARIALELQLSQAEHEYATLAEQVQGQAGYAQQVRALQAESARFAALQAEVERLRSAEAALSEQLSVGDQLALEQSQHERIIEQARSEIEKVLHVLEQTIERCQPQIDRLPMIEARLANLATRLAVLDEQAESLAELRSAVAETEREEARLREQGHTITKQGKEISGKLELLQQGAGICPVCQSELGPDGLHTVKAQYIEQQTTLRTELRASKRTLEACTAQVAAHRAAITALETALKERSAVERQQATLLEQQAQATVARNERATAQAEMVVHNERLALGSYAEAAQAHLRDVQQRLAALGDRAALHMQREQHRATIRQYEGQLGTAAQTERQLAEAEAQLRACTTAAERMPVINLRVNQLKQQLAKEDYAHEARRARNAIRQKIDALAYTKAEHDALKAEVERLNPAEGRKRDLERAIEDLQRDEQQLARDTELGEHRQAQIVADRTEIAMLAPKLREQRALEFALREAEAALQAVQETLANAQRELGSAEADLRHCAEVVAQLQTYREQAAYAREQRDLFAELTEYLGKKGIQAMLIDNALPEIEHEANRLLGRLTDHQMHVTLDTQRDTKKGDTIETLDIRIADGLGTRDYTMYSGGEAFRVNFALRIALSKLLAHRAGASLKTLVIDEGFGTQDGKGRDQVVEAINAISDDFARVLVITHIQELKDQFQTQIEITKGLNGSTWRIV